MSSPPSYGKRSTPNDYELRQEAKRERLTAAAEKARERSEQHSKAAHDVIDHIPFGQPILVGHHSEKAHRNALKRSWRHMDRMLEESGKAQDLDRRAASVGKGGISSDDPEAVRKLMDQLAGLEETRKLWKRVNAAHRAYLKNPSGLDTCDLSQEWRDRVRSYELAYSWEPHPVAPYQLTNLGANIRRIRKRIEELGNAETAPEREPIRGDGFQVTEDREENRIRFEFDERPPRETCQLMRQFGFKWNRRLVAWTRHLNNAGWHAAQEVARKLGEVMA